MALGIIFLFGGAILALYGVYMVVSYHRLTGRLTAKTAGRLVGFAYGSTRKRLGQSAPRESKELIHLKVSYQAGGRNYVLPERQTLSSEKVYAEGMALEVLYDPEEPQVFRVAGNRADLKSGYMLLATGAGIALLAALLMWL